VKARILVIEDTALIATGWSEPAPGRVYGQFPALSVTAIRPNPSTWF
jgi:hypothetical protein